jgi:hypothetical protein
VWSALPGNQNTDFADLHQLALGTRSASRRNWVPTAARCAMSRARRWPPSPPGNTVLPAVNWTSQPSPAPFGDLDQILAGTLPPGSRFRLPGQLYDLSGRRFIDLTDPDQTSAPLVPGSDPGNPQLPRFLVPAEQRISRGGCSHRSRRNVTQMLRGQPAWLVI